MRLELLDALIWSARSMSNRLGRARQRLDPHPARAPGRPGPKMIAPGFIRH